MSESEAKPSDDDAEPAGDEPTEDQWQSGDDDTDVSREVQSDVSKLEQAVWHAPQGKGTKIAAVLILVLLLGTLVALLVLAIASAVS